MRISRINAKPGGFAQNSNQNVCPLAVCSPALIMAGAKCDTHSRLDLDHSTRSLRHPSRMTIVSLGYIASFSSLAGRNAMFLLAAIEISRR